MRVASAPRTIPDMDREWRGPREGLVWPVRLDPTGQHGPTRVEARSKRWRQSSWGLHVPSEVDSAVPEQRIVEAAARLPAHGAVTGWAALRWLGATWFDGRDADIVLAVMRGDVRRQRGIDVSHERLSPRTVIEVDGVRVTVPARSACFEMRYAADLRSAVLAGDMAARADLVSRAELTQHVEGCSGWTGVPLARKALDLVEENSWSPRETRTRLIWCLDAGLPAPACNVPVFDRNGHHLATPDIVDPVAGVVGEYDGLHHLEAGQRRRDVRREDALRDAGLEYFTVLGGESDAAVVRRMLNTRARARFEDPATRRWTLDLPPGWAPLRTVEQRRARRLQRRPAESIVRDVWHPETGPSGCKTSRSIPSRGWGPGRGQPKRPEM